MSGAPAREDKRQEIVELAFDRFYDSGFHATGVDTVMAGSGISKRTLYKYFPSKEELIEAVLAHYGEFIVHELFDPVEAIENPRDQIMAVFDVRQSMMAKEPTRGCLGIKAAQEYIGKHERIQAFGNTAASMVENRFIKLCERARLSQPKKLGKQIGILFQGALLLAHVADDQQAFASAKGVVSLLLESGTNSQRGKTQQGISKTR